MAHVPPSPKGYAGITAADHDPPVLAGWAQLAADLPQGIAYSCSGVCMTQLLYLLRLCPNFTHSKV